MSDFIVFGGINMDLFAYVPRSTQEGETIEASSVEFYLGGKGANQAVALSRFCLLYTSPSPRDRQKSRMPSSA